jgi:hypothetical protein
MFNRYALVNIDTGGAVKHDRDGKPASIFQQVA